MEIIATFTGGRSATYTTAVFGLLITDPATEYIIDAVTGELLWERR